MTMMAPTRGRLAKTRAVRLSGGLLRGPIHGHPLVGLPRQLPATRRSTRHAGNDQHLLPMAPPLAGLVGHHRRDGEVMLVSTTEH